MKMASLRSCGDLLLYVCGENVAVFDFRCPENVSILSLPDINNQQQNKQQQKHKNGSKDKPNTKPTDNANTLVPNRILATDVSSDGRHIAVCDDRKYLHVFRDDGHGNHSSQQLQQASGDGDGQGRWKLASSRCVSRRCTGVRFTSDLQSILVADKSGDVFSFPTEHVSTTPSTTASSNTATSSSSSSLSSTSAAVSSSSSDGTTSSECPTSESTSSRVDVETGEKIKEVEDVEIGDVGDTIQNGDADGDGDVANGGTLILGHLSMLLDMVLLDGDCYVATADRDEKIRISCYPDAYNIKTYCLGHTAFVISLACDESKKILFSGSGDGCVGMWGYDGSLLDLRNCVEDFPQLKDGDDNATVNTNAEKDEEDKTTTTTDEMKTAVQQIVYCSSTNLLFVAMYKCPHVLIYRLSQQQPSSLQPIQLLTPTTTPTPTPTSISSYITSLCVRGSVLWVVREAGWPQLQLEAFLCGVQGDKVVATPYLMSGEVVECKILEAMASHCHLLKAPETWQDSIPTLWKSTTDGYIHEYMERKRQRVEGEGGRNYERWGKKKRGKGRKSKS